MDSSLQTLSQSLGHWQAVYIVSIVVAVMSTFAIVVFAFHIQEHKFGLKVSNYIYVIASLLAVLATIVILNKTHSLDIEKDRVAELNIAHARSDAAKARSDAATSNQKAQVAEQQASEENSRAAEALKASEIARKDAEGLSLQIAQANERAAEAEKTSEELLKDNLELREKIQPRIIRADKKDALLRSLKTIPKGPVLVGYDWMDTEANLCAQEILTPLVAAGFPARFIYEKNGPWQVLNLGEVGIVVVVNANDPARVPAQTFGVVNSFAEAGLPPMRLINIGNVIKLDDETILIWCGKKP